MTWVLWGFNPAYPGKDGYPYPVRLTIGSERECMGEFRRREEQGWVTGRYRQGVRPEGLIALCDEAYPLRSRLGEAS